MGLPKSTLTTYSATHPPQAAARGLACLERIVAVLPGPDLDAVLTIPLEPGSWDLPHPSLEDLMALNWSYGPGRSVPGLYVVHGTQWRLAEQVEEYKQPLDSPNPSLGLVAYYRAWRGVGDPEFDRASTCGRCPPDVRSCRCADDGPAARHASKVTPPPRH